MRYENKKECYFNLFKGDTLSEHEETRVFNIPNAKKIYIYKNPAYGRQRIS